MNRTDDEVKKAISLNEEKLRDFGPAKASEKLGLSGIHAIDDTVRN